MNAERHYILKNPLSDNEQETLWLAGKGYRNREIAVKLPITYKTVKNRLWKARKKLSDLGVLQYESDNRKHYGESSNPLSVYTAGLAAEHGLIRPLPEKRRIFIKTAKIQLFGTE